MKEKKPDHTGKSIHRLSRLAKFKRVVEVALEVADFEVTSSVRGGTDPPSTKTVAVVKVVGAEVAGISSISKAGY